MQHGVQVYLVVHGQVLQDMTPWIPFKELALRAEEICQRYSVHRSNSDDLIKAPFCICLCVCKNMYTYTYRFGQAQAKLRDAARECVKGNIQDSKTLDKKINKRVRGRGREGRGRGRPRRRGSKLPANVGDKSEPHGGQDLCEEDSEDAEIRRKLMQEEDPEDDHMVCCSMSTISINSKVLHLGVHSEVSVAERCTAEAPN